MPDEIMMEMISTKVQNLGVESSWLLDGFPRTRGQAVMFDDALRGRGHALNLVLHLDVPNDVVMSRILDRWIHEKSGRTYNMRFDPPKVEGKDDVTGEDLVKRSDDDAVRSINACFDEVADQSNFSCSRRHSRLGSTRSRHRQSQ